MAGFLVGLRVVLAELSARLGLRRARRRSTVVSVLAAGGARLPAVERACAQFRAGGSLVHVCGGRPVDRQAKELGSAVVTACVHKALAMIDLGEIQVRDHLAF